MGQLVFVTGMSGAGRGVAGNALDDMGWFVIDNLPPMLLPKVAELAAGGGNYDRVALVMAGADATMPAAISELRSQLNDVQVLYLEASDEVLVRRFESTKRRHPTDTGGSLIDAIQAERIELVQARQGADLVIDTSDLSPHQLRQRLATDFGDTTNDEGLSLTISSFGFKHGVPLDVDLVIDCRFLPNPYWDESLRGLRGTDPDVRQFVFDTPLADPFLERMKELLDVLLPAYQSDGRSYLNIAFGCTGGHHRSVATAEYIAEQLTTSGWRPRLKHRDVER